jgi:tetratricopeptide (TPR) repeat protein
MAFSSDLSRIGQTLKLMFADTSYTIQLFLGAVAFYVGKFFVPLPLNAAIREIDTLYSLAGAALLVFCLYLLSRPSLFSGLVLSGFLMIAPALPLAFGTIAWTAYAERYVYLALPFWILAAGCILTEVSERRQKLQAAGTILLLAAMALIVIHRGQVWATNIALCSDMVAKSPDFKMAHGLYMSALIQAGRYDEVEEQYRIASRLPSVRYEEQYDLVMASVYMKHGRDVEAEQMLLSALKKSKGKNPGIFQALANYYDTISRTAPPLERDKYQKLALSYTQQRYDLDKDPHTLYQVAKIHLQMGNIESAKQVLHEVLKSLKSGDTDRIAAEKLLVNLKGRTGQCPDE